MSRLGTGKPLSFYYKIQENGRWIWVGGRSGNYGVCRYKGKVTKAHIAVYLEQKGFYNPYLELDHLKDICSSTFCVNPEHLEPVTHKENVLRGNSLQANNARKTHCPQGHEFAEDNIFRYKNGRRGCKICIRERGKQKNAMKMLLNSIGG